MVTDPVPKQPFSQNDMHSVILGNIVVTLSPNNTLMSDELILIHSNKIHSFWSPLASERPAIRNLTYPCYFVDDW